MDTIGDEHNLKVLMLPWLAHGHISPFMELAKRLSKRNFIVYLCSTPVNLSSIKRKLTQHYSASVHLVDLHLPSSDVDSTTSLPPHYHTTNGLPPRLMPSLKAAFDAAGPAFSTIITTLNPDLIIYDFLQPWAPTVAASHNIPAFLFFTSAAASTSFLTHIFDNPNVEFPFPEIYIRDNYENKNLTRLRESSPNKMLDSHRFFRCFEQSSNIILIKTFREIEGKYIDHLSSLTKKKMVPVGPLVQYPDDFGNNDGDAEIIEWLNKKDQNSTVLVSFGTEYFLSNEDMEEVAHGLELSRVCFVWVIRNPLADNTEITEKLPKGFLARVGERGMVVEWAPQPKILRHGSVGGIVSHCGWGSVTEAMECGVPVIALPMHLDQPLNARLVAELGVGVEAVRDEEGRLRREKVAKVIREVVFEKSGESVRRRAREMSEIIREKGEREIDRAVEEMVRICGHDAN